MERLTLFELMGRDVGMFSFMRKFYRRVCSDPLISYRYDSKNLPIIQRKFKVGLTRVLKETGSSDAYEWGFEDEEFDRILGHMMAVVRETFLQPEDIKRFRDTLLGSRSGSNKLPENVSNRRSGEPLAEE